MRCAGLLKYLMLICSLLLSTPLGADEDGVFEVKGTAVNSILYNHGKVSRDTAGDEVIYLVNIPEGTVTRTAVFNRNIKDKDKDSWLGGIQSDNTVYKIFHDEPNGALAGQHIIKAFGQAGVIDGYEMMVIGEDFVTTSRSTRDYFVLYHYKRTDIQAEAYRHNLESNKRRTHSFLEQLSKWFGGW